MTITEYEKKINANKNRNTRFVVIRTERHCNKCEVTLPTGTKCLTTNKKDTGRHWYCMKCVQGYLDYKELTEDGIDRTCHIYQCIVNTYQDYNNLPYDDEGGAMADLDALAEYESDCFHCGKCNFPELLQQQYEKNKEDCY